MLALSGSAVEAALEVDEDGTGLGRATNAERPEAMVGLKQAWRLWGDTRGCNRSACPRQQLCTGARCPGCPPFLRLLKTSGSRFGSGRTELIRLLKHLRDRARLRHHKRILAGIRQSSSFLQASLTKR